MAEERREEQFGPFPPYMYEDQYAETIEIDVGSIPTTYSALTAMLFEERSYVPVRYFKRLCRDNADLLVSITFGTLAFVLIIRLFTFFKKILLEIEETN